MRKLLLATAASLSTLLAAGTAQAQSLKPVAPGTILIHLNGYLQFDFGAIGGNGMKGGSGATAFKNNSIATTGDVRLYPGFDGMTVDGLAYGAQIELRTALTNANGSGVNNNSTSTNGVGSLYVRRAYGYIGTTNYGYVRFGQGDGAFELLQRGAGPALEAFGDGSQWTGEGTEVTMLPSGAPLQFIYADQGALYTTDKLVYISPAVEEPLLGGKFDAGVSYEPSSNGLKEGDASVSSLGGNPNDSIAGGSAKLRRNTVDGVLDYSVKIDGFATKVSGGFLASSPDGDLGAAQPYSPMDVWQIGAQTSYAGLITPYDSIIVGANVKGGSVTDKYGFKKKGGRDALAYIVSAIYTTGPYVLGTSFFDSQESNGVIVATKVPGHTLSEYGVTVGGNYIVAKPLSLYVQYMYGNVHGASSTAFAATAHGNDHVEAITAGATFKW